MSVVSASDRRLTESRFVGPTLRQRTVTAIARARRIKTRIGRRMSLRRIRPAEVLIQLRQPPGVLVVRGLEQLRGPLRPRRRPRRSSTFGGWPACGQASATSALIALTSSTPPTVEPGETGVSRPSICHHRVAGRGAGVEHEVGEVLQLLAARVVAAAGLGVPPADDARRPSCRAAETARPSRSARRCSRWSEMTSAVSCVRQVEIAEDALGEAGDVLEEHRLPLAVGADDEVVERQRQLDDRVEARETSRSAATSPRPGSGCGPEPKTWTIRPARIVAANQSAACADRGELPLDGVGRARGTS